MNLHDLSREIHFERCLNILSVLIVCVYIYYIITRERNPEYIFSVVVLYKKFLLRKKKEREIDREKCLNIMSALTVKYIYF